MKFSFPSSEQKSQDKVATKYIILNYTACDSKQQPSSNILAMHSWEIPWVKASLTFRGETDIVGAPYLLTRMFCLT